MPSVFFDRRASRAADQEDEDGGADLQHELNQLVFIQRHQSLLDGSTLSHGRLGSTSPSEVTVPYWASERDPFTAG